MAGDVRDSQSPSDQGMKDSELFKACRAQCIWCQEQWPLEPRDGHYVHTAPFTRDPYLFSQPCKAEPIRVGFNYYDFKGGDQVVWEPRSPKDIVELLTDYYNRCNKESKGLGMQISSPKNRRFWRGPIHSTIEVAGWPDWMQGGRVTPERLKRCRDELLFFDELDHWTRQPCTENLQYRPALDDKGCLTRPTCNDSIGCVGCWDRYERESDRYAANDCY